MDGRRSPFDEATTMKMRFGSLLAALLILFQAAAPSLSGDSISVSMRVDAKQTQGPLNPIWRFFGADEPNYAYMKNGKKLIEELGELAPKRVYFRTHNLLTSGNGTPALKWGSTGAYSEDAKGNAIYDWLVNPIRKGAPLVRDRSWPTETARCIPVTPRPVLLASWTWRNSTASNSKEP
jgi:hypothetical protein